MSLGPFKSGSIIRIPLAVTVCGQSIAVTSPRIQRLILPDTTDATGYPKDMIELEAGVYYLEIQLTEIGNYIAIIRAELSGDTIEDIESFNVVSIIGMPRIEVG